VADPETLEQRLARLEDLEQIRALVARYVFAIDDRDLATVGNLFTRDGRFRSRDGVMDASGREAVLAQFEGRFAALGPTNHFSHDHLVWLDEASSGRARGLVSSHAEVVRNDRPMIVALRYEDAYRREDGAWRFADRLLSFLYYVDVRDYAEVIRTPLRMRAYDRPAPADYPENLDTWRRHRGT
jgi:ketosteroid isomerase-like protein